MTSDLRSTPVSCGSQAALALYEQALREYQSYVGDAVATIDRALAEQPDFVLGHAFRAGVLAGFGERRFMEEARRSVTVAEPLAAASASDRERGLVRAARHLVDGDWDAACAAYDRVLVDHPRDAFALQTAHLFDFYRGDALNLRNRVARVLPHWDESVPGWSFVVGMHAFGLEECNQYAAAEEAARRALQAEPRDGWAVHAAVHCLEMTGRTDEGIAWLDSRRGDWAPNNGFAFHNWWHLALLHLERGDDGQVLALYDESILAQPSDVALQLVDATALLWRLRLLGVDVGARWATVAAAWAAKLDGEAGFYAFNDAHAMMAFAATGDEANAARVLERVGSSIGGEVGLPVAAGLLAFARGRHAEAVEHLEPVRDRAHAFGGSHAQRDLLTLTLVAAARAAGRTRLAAHYVAERRMRRGPSRFDAIATA